MSFSSSTATMNSVRRLFGFELSDGNGNTRCQLNVKINLNTVLCILAVFFIGLLFGYIIFHSGSVGDDHSDDFSNAGPAVSSFSPFIQSTKATRMETQLVKQEMNRRKGYVRRMAQNAWKAYAKYAWGKMGLKPISKNAYTEEDYNHFTMGLTLLQSLSTLWVMNLTAEYKHGRTWVHQNFNFSDITTNVMLRSAVPRYLGSLLSIHALTGDSMYLEKIRQLETIIKPAFSRVNGLPYNTLQPSVLRAQGDSNYLTTAGAFHLELGYLGDLLNSSSTFWRETLSKNRRALASIANHNSDGLYMQSVDADEGTWNSQTASVQECVAPYYASLLHAYLRSNRTDEEALQLYREAMEAAEQASLITTATKDGHIYTRDLNTAESYSRQKDRFDSFMHYEGCGLAGVLALGADALEDQLPSSPVARRREMFEIYAAWRQADGLAETCHSAALQTLIGLPPERIYFEDGRLAKTNPQHSAAHLTPPLAASYFTLYRLTGEEKWRDYAWEMAHSIDYHCRWADSGYANPDNVEKLASFEDLQPDDFIGGTLKYLYLTFTDPSDHNYLPLDQWVFNVVGQPIPICGRNEQYPATERCF